MSNNEIGFNATYETRVKLKIDSILNELDANLSIPENSPAILTTNNHPGFVIKLSEKEKLSLKCSSNSTNYTFINCQPSGESVFPEYIIKEESSEDFYGIEINIKGLSAWFEDHTYFKITGAFADTHIPPLNFNEKICIKGEQYQISSHHNDKNSHRTEKTAIKIMKLGGSITPSDGENLAQQIRLLFSLLLGLPLDIESAWLLQGQDKNQRPFYFNKLSSPKSTFKYTNECFIRSPFIFDNNLWCPIFENFFSAKPSTHFRNIWPKLSAIFSYKGLWKYELLTYVSILNNYIEEFANENCIKLPTENFSEIKKDLLGVITKAQKTAGPEFDEITNRLKDSIKGIENTNLATFEEKHNNFMSNINADIKSMINLTHGDLLEILKIRELVAKEPSIQSIDTIGITNDISIKYKLQVMLMYLIYSDFGFSPAQFAKCLTRTHCIFVQSTDINKLFRDKLAGDIPFYDVDQQSFRESLKDKNQCIIIELDKTENTHYYNKALTKEVKDHWSSNTSLTLNDFIQSMAHETLIVETIKQAYITCDEKAFPLHNLLLITCP